MVLVLNTQMFRKGYGPYVSVGQAIVRSKYKPRKKAKRKETTKAGAKT